MLLATLAATSITMDLEIWTQQETRFLSGAWSEIDLLGLNLPGLSRL